MFKNISFFFIFFSLLLCFWGEKGRAECCPLEIYCVPFGMTGGGYPLREPSHPDGKYPFHAPGFVGGGCCKPAGVENLKSLCRQYIPECANGCDAIFHPKDQGFDPSCARSSPC